MMCHELSLWWAHLSLRWLTLWAEWVVLVAGVPEAVAPVMLSGRQLVDLDMMWSRNGGHVERRAGQRG